MEREENLKKALNNLKDYRPSERVWNNIELLLDEEELSTPLRQAVQKLPVYSPPDNVWQGISQHLGGQQSKAISLKWWLSAAAAVFVCLIGGYIYLAEPSEPRFSYSEEVLDHTLQVNDLQEDEQAFNLVEELCREKAFLCQNPEVQQLREELDELTLACNTLKDAIGDYNTDPELISTLTRIELERTEVLKKLVSLI